MVVTLGANVRIIPNSCQSLEEECFGSLARKHSFRKQGLFSVCVCAFVFMEIKKRASDPLDLELQILVGDTCYPDVRV